MSRLVHILYQMQIYLLTPYNSIVVLRRFRFIKMFIAKGGNITVGPYLSELLVVVRSL